MSNTATIECLHQNLIDEFEKTLSGYAPSDKKMIMKAACFADSAHGAQLRKSGEPYIIHPIAVAGILVGLDMDAPSVCAGLLKGISLSPSLSFSGLFAVVNVSSLPSG